MIPTAEMLLDGDIYIKKIYIKHIENITAKYYTDVKSGYFATRAVK